MEDIDLRIDEGEEFIQNTYSYILTDLRDNAIISELPFHSVSYEKNVSKESTADLSLTINDETIELNPNAFTIPGRVGVYILRNEKVMWGGFISNRQYESDSRTVRLSCKSFENYLYRRLQRQNLNYPSNKTVEQIQIARDIVQNNNAQTDLKIDIDTATNSGRKRERNMYSYEFKTVGEELERLSSLIDGFDWNVDVYQDPTTRELKRKLNFYYPHRGKSQADTDLLFEFPGVIRDFTISDDTQDGVNILWGIGAGEGTEQLEFMSYDKNQVDTQKFPRLEGTVSYKSVSEKSTLQSHVEGDLKKQLSPVTVIEVTLRGDGEGQFDLGTYDIGDWARFRIEDPFLPKPIDEYHRITGYKVSVEDNSGLETVTLVLGDDDANLSDDSELGE